MEGESCLFLICCNFLSVTVSETLWTESEQTVEDWQGEHEQLR